MSIREYPPSRSTSFIFEGLLERSSDGKIIAENVAVHVWLNHKTDVPVPVPNDFRKLVQRFEGEHCMYPVASNYCLRDYDKF